MRVPAGVYAISMCFSGPTFCCPASQVGSFTSDRADALEKSRSLLFGHDMRASVHLQQTRNIILEKF